MSLKAEIWFILKAGQHLEWMDDQLLILRDEREKRALEAARKELIGLMFVACRD